MLHVRHIEWLLQYPSTTTREIILSIRVTLLAIVMANRILGATLTHTV